MTQPPDEASLEYEVRVETPDEHPSVVDLLDRVFGRRVEAGGRAIRGSVFDTYWVAVTPGGAVIGAVCVNKGGRISDLAVDSRFRGHGIGRRLLDAAESAARRDGLASASVSVDSTDQRLMSTYGRHGYVAVHPPALTSPNLIVLRKTLAPDSVV